MTPRRRMLTSGLASFLLVVSGCTDGDESVPTRAASTPPASPSVGDDECAMPDEPAPSPRAGELRGRIAYGRGTSEVMVLNLATARTTQVTSRKGREGWDFDPSFTPDGRLIAYRSEHAGDAEIRVVDVRSGDDRALTDNVDADWSPAFSPDGRTIAYSTDRDDFTQHVAVMPADGGAPTILAPDIEGEYPTWSPDGGTIAFASLVGTEYDIYSVAVDGEAEPVNLTDDPANDFLPVWSPDGSTIVFQSERCDAGPNRSELFAMDADGSNVRRLTDRFAEQPAWSPDSRWLVFNSWQGLAVMDARGGEFRLLRAVGSGTLPDWTASESSRPPREFYRPRGYPATSVVGFPA